MILSRKFRRARAQKTVSKAIDTMVDSGLDLGAGVAAVLVAGRQPERLFTSAELEAAVDVALAGVKEKWRDDWGSSGAMPGDVEHAIAWAFSKGCRSNIRRGLFSALPADVIAIEGVG